jgi:putative flippase GtrA
MISLKKLRLQKHLLNRMVCLYLIFGILTTVVNIVLYIFFTYSLEIYYIYSNVLAWFFSVVFAYITNRIWVFESKSRKILLEFTLFVGGRLFSGFLDTFLLYVFVGLFNFNNLLSKIAIGIFIVILNYIFSRDIVFKL